MREIKFRAYVKGGGGWRDSKECRLYFDQMLSDPDVTFMQFTGIKDKNGKEIYEGDIVRDPNKGVMQVEFVGSAWYTFNKEFSYGKLMWDGDGFYEVIGNVFENPELLPN